MSGGMVCTIPDPDICPWNRKFGGLDKWYSPSIYHFSDYLIRVTKWFTPRVGVDFKVWFCRWVSSFPVAHNGLLIVIDNYWIFLCRQRLVISYLSDPYWDLVFSLYILTPRTSYIWWRQAKCSRKGRDWLERQVSLVIEEVCLCWFLE